MTDRLSDSWFLQLRQNADEVLRTRQRARELFVQRPPERFDGIGHLLGKVLPSDSDVVTRFAEALGVAGTLVAQLRASELDPVHFPRGPLVLIGQALDLTEESFLELVWRDHSRFVELERGTIARGPSRETGDIRRSLHEAWARAALDDPQNQ